jgi:hypothetical protein
MFNLSNPNIKKFIRTDKNIKIISEIINNFLDNEYISTIYRDFTWDFCKYSDDSSYHHCIISIKNHSDNNYCNIEIVKRYSTSLIKYIDLLNEFNNLLVDSTNMITIIDNNNNKILYHKTEPQYDIINKLNKLIIKKNDIKNIKSMMSCKCIYAQCDMLSIYCNQEKIKLLYDLDKNIVKLLLSLSIIVIQKTDNSIYMDYCEVTPWILLYNCYSIYYNDIIETIDILNTIHDLCLNYINQNSKKNVIISRIISKLIAVEINNKYKFLDLQKILYETSNKITIDKYISYNVQQYLVY